MAQPTPSRDSLMSRTFPSIILSTGSNPLTAPTTRAQDPNLMPAARAVRRFAVEGNAIVTGAAGAIGLEATRALLEHGLQGICIFDIAPSFRSAQSALDGLRADFPAAKILTEEVDVTDEHAIKDAVDRTALKLGSIDILFCAAGVFEPVHAADLTSQQWKRVLDINTTGSWFCAQAVGRLMIKQGTGGSIIFIASIAAHRVNYPQPHLVYGVSKAALLQLKGSLAAEWARYGIRVNSISPGYIDTPLNSSDAVESLRNVWTERNPMGRMGDLSELAGVIVLLCSRAGKYINGADIVVDGGATVF